MKGPDAKHLEKFKNNVSVHKHLGGEPGGSAKLVNDQLSECSVNPDHATDNQRDQAKVDARETHLARACARGRAGRCGLAGPVPYSAAVG